MNIGPYSKSIGPFTLSVTDKGGGVFEGAIALSGKLGGGSAAGVAKFGGSLYCDLTLEQVVEIGFADLNKVLPASVLPVAEMGEAAVEAEIAKL